MNKLYRCICIAALAVTVLSFAGITTTAAGSSSKPILKQLFKNVGLSRYAESLANLSRNSIQIQSKSATEKTLAIGKSKLGGHPDLPSNIKWPKWKGKSLSFIAQLNLSESAKYDVDKQLPKQGILYFFYDAAQQAWGFNPNDRDGWKVIYYTGRSSNLHRRKAPSDLPKQANFKACSLTFSQRNNLAPSESIDIERLNMSESEFSKYQDMLAPMAEYCEVHTTHKLLGHPDIIQNEMQMDCQLASHGIYCGNAKGYKNPRAQALKAGATDWVLLLQVDTDDSIDMMWGDAGKLYYWIPKSALRKRDFSKVWVQMQCY